MDYTINDICKKVNTDFKLYEDSLLEDGEDVWNFIKFQQDLYFRVYSENADLMDELTRVKSELYEYKKKYGGI